MISSLQSLRGIFTIFIFLHHIADFGAGGACGVSFFMILSGFVLCDGYQSRIEAGTINFKGFINKRLAKIYPLHIICLFCAIVLSLNKIHFGWGTLAIYTSNLLLLQSWIPLSDFYFSGNAVGWFLSAILFAYAVFPFIIRFINCSNSRTRLFKALTGTLIIYFIVVILIPGKYSNSIIYVNPLFRVVDFIIGIALWQLWHRFRHGRSHSIIESLSFATKSTIELAVFAIYACAILIYPNVEAKYAEASFWWIPSVCAIVVFAAFNRSGGILTRLLHNRWIIWFGNISFSFYMIHNLMIRCFQILLIQMHILLPPLATMTGIFIITVMAAYLVNRYFEKPASHWWLTKRMENGDSVLKL